MSGTDPVVKRRGTLEHSTRTKRGCATVLTMAILSSAVFLPCQPAESTEYFVGIDHPNASDSNSGLSTDHPFRTIGRGVQGLQPGDTLSIMAGVYRESVGFSRSGTSTQPIVLRALPGHEGDVAIRGSDVVMGWTNEGNNVWSVAWDPLPLINYPAGFPDYGPYSRRREMVFVDGIPFEQVLSPGELASGRFWMDDAARRLRIVSTVDPDDRQVEISVRTQGVMATGSYIVFRGLKVEHVTTDVFTGAMHLGSHQRVEDCRVEYNNGHGIVVYSNSVLVNTTANNNGRLGVGLNGDDSLLSSCETSYNSWRYGPMWEAGGVKVVGNTPPIGNRFVGHVARYNNGPGVWLDTVGSGNIVEECFFEGNVLTSLDFEAAMGPNWIINNVIVGTDKTDENYWGLDGAGILLYEALDTSIYNNTIVDSSGSGLVIYGGQRGPYYCAGTQVFNNIIVNSGESAVFMGVSDLSRAASNVTSHHFDNNLYHNNPTMIVFPDVSTPYNLFYWSLDQWQANQGEDLDSISQPPDFVNPGASDFSLSPASPAIDAGDDSVGVQDDFHGCRRPKGAHIDIGAYEYCVEPSLPTPGAPPSLSNPTFSRSLRQDTP